MYKLIACDLDQTLLCDDRSISKNNIDAINKAIDSGIKFVIATGRGFTSVQNVLSDIGILGSSDEYVISLNGAIITENKDNKVLSFTGVDFDTVKKLFTYGIDNSLCTHIYTENDIYVYNINDSEIEYLRGRVDNYQVIKDHDVSFLKDVPIAKVILHFYDETIMDKIITDIKPLTDNKLSVSFSSNRYVELNQLNVDKGTGLQKLAQLLNVEMSDTLAIGDNFNDLSMILTAGIGACVSNSRSAVKAASDYVCLADNNHDAIREVIDKFIFQE